jgi:hypothetical protein
MHRKAEYLNMLRSFAHMQESIADILEYKAIEADKSTKWLLQHYHLDRMPSAHACLKEELKVHEHLVEAIDGVTKMEAALSRNLKCLLHQEESSPMGGFPMMGSFGEEDS